MTIKLFTAHIFANPFLLKITRLLKWLLILLIVSLLAGAASTVFLYLLDLVTHFRIGHMWVIGLLPIAGFLVAWVYQRIGKNIEAGGALLLEEIHQPNNVVPLRMMPLVLAGTLISHLFGASVGREGTAIQMSGALADQLTHIFKLSSEQRRILIIAAICAGFSSVFGTPLAGAIFGLEVVALSKLRMAYILPCFITAIVANHISVLLGVSHTHFFIPHIPSITTWGIIACIMAGIIFGLSAKFFNMGVHGVSNVMARYISYVPMRPFIVGAIISIAVYVLGTDRYIGLGIPTMLESFQHGLGIKDYLAKMLFTIASLGGGFKGGEVTPLFYIGAVLGNVLSGILQLPLPLLAGIGFVAVFAGAASTPIACTIMAMELFGSSIGVYAGLACLMSYLFSGHLGMYIAQRTKYHRYTKIL